MFTVTPYVHSDPPVHSAPPPPPPPSVRSDMHSVCSILAGELLVDVHRVCAGCGDDPFPLERYLLAGRGSLLLAVLNTLQLQARDADT